MEEEVELTLSGLFLASESRPRDVGMADTSPVGETTGDLIGEVGYSSMVLELQFEYCDVACVQAVCTFSFPSRNVTTLSMAEHELVVLVHEDVVVGLWLR